MSAVPVSPAIHGESDYWKRYALHLSRRARIGPAIEGRDSRSGQGVERVGRGQVGHESITEPWRPMKGRPRSDS